MSQRNKNAEKKFSKYKNNASKQDIKIINSKIGGMNKGALKEVWGTVMELWALVKDPKAAWSSKAIAIGALLYVISPIDAIPDILPVIGLVDDVSVVALAVASLRSDLKKYSTK